MIIAITGTISIRASAIITRLPTVVCVSVRPVVTWRITERTSVIAIAMGITGRMSVVGIGIVGRTFVKVVPIVTITKMLLSSIPIHVFKTEVSSGRC